MRLPISVWITDLSVINEVLHNLFFVEPAIVSVVKPLRQVPVIQSLSMQPLSV